MNKPLILVVEDDIPVRNLITITLKTHGYRYLTAGTGDGAVVEASSHNPDVVLLDLGLPDMDGVDVIRKIRTWSNLPMLLYVYLWQLYVKNWKANRMPRSIYRPT